MNESTSRNVLATHAAVRDDIGDLITRRPLPGVRIEQVDPFLFLNHHGPQTYPPGNRGLPFGPHPHRGFETLTFILAGSLSHEDSGGHASVIHAGGVQWMTAGSGLEHAELSPEEFLRNGGPLEILQLWINLPARLKMTPPSYIGLQGDQIPVFRNGDGTATVHLIAGSWDGKSGPVESITGVHMSWIDLKPGGTLDAPAPAGRNVFLYLVRGTVRIGTREIAEHHLVELTQSGDHVPLEALTDAVVLFGHAQPLNEPVVAHGPFVMNTREEIFEAIRDYQAGRFRRDTI